MKTNEMNKFIEHMNKIYRPHPWHGLPLHTNRIDEFTAYIEIVATDTVKYEIDKENGYLKVERSQNYSNMVIGSSLYFQYSVLTLCFGTG